VAVSGLRAVAVSELPAKAVCGLREAIPRSEWLRVCDACSEGTWRDSSSILSSSPVELSGIAGETLAVVGWGVTSQILSARMESDSRLPSVWPSIWLANVVADDWPK
jgi:hypothetical protein